MVGTQTITETFGLDDCRGAWLILGYFDSSATEEMVQRILYY